ncbi:MAG: acyl-CoA synthetase [Lachnospiraceae bacterium]|nr:acyl-CoA synthetase [Lachnospiraceae bacterium]
MLVKKYPTPEEVMESIRKYHNHSWYEDIYMRNKERKNHVALFFRNSTYTYGEFFETTEKYARSLKSLGISKGDEFVACLQQTPDYPLLIAAASLVGAKINLINSSFDIDYIGDIILRANANVLFVSDWDFVKLSPVFRKVNKKIVVLSVDYWEKVPNPYKETQEKFCDFNRLEYQNEIRKYDDIFSTETFIEQGESYFGEINGHGKLEDDLAITYTSGSTKKD